MRLFICLFLKNLKLSFYRYQIHIKYAFFEKKYAVRNKILHKRFENFFFFSTRRNVYERFWFLDYSWVPYMVVLTKTQGGGEKEWEISYNTCFEESGLGVGVVLRGNLISCVMLIRKKLSVHLEISTLQLFLSQSNQPHPRSSF